MLFYVKCNTLLCSFYIHVSILQFNSNSKNKLTKICNWYYVSSLSRCIIIIVFRVCKKTCLNLWVFILCVLMLLSVVLCSVDSRWILYYYQIQQSISFPQNCWLNTVVGFTWNCVIVLISVNLPSFKATL